MNKIAPLVPVEAAINQELIRHLTGMLADAKSGELVAAAYVCRWSNNKISDGWSALDSLTMYDLIARLEVLKGQIIRAILDKEQEEQC